MTVGWKKVGVEIDTLFMGRVSTAAPNTNLRYGGVDLAQLLEPRAGSAAIGATNIKSVAVDINSTFRDIALPLATVSLSLTQIRVDRTDDGTPAELHINADGKVYHRVSGSLVSMGNWVSGSSPALYASRLIVSSGTLTSGLNNTWEPLNVTRSWTRSAAAGTTQSVNLTSVEIRRISDSVVMATALGGYIICTRG